MPKTYVGHICQMVFFFEKFSTSQFGHSDEPTESVHTPQCPALLRVNTGLVHLMGLLSFSVSSESGRRSLFANMVAVMNQFRNLRYVQDVCSAFLNNTALN